MYGWGNILQAIDAAFEEQSTRVASVALWGTAGIGRTQIALEVAHRHWSGGEGAVLWITSETYDTAADSNEAALELHLDENPGSNKKDKNWGLVVQWLWNTCNCRLPPLLGVRFS
jgi:hypothetical protein